jgi:Flp pilus assembly protein TadG
MSVDVCIRRRRIVMRKHRQDRRGSIIVLAAIMMMAMMGFLALTIDLGYVMNARSELKRATDAAALAGAGALIDGQEQADLQAFEFFARNPVAGETYAATDAEGGSIQCSDPTWKNYLTDLLTEHRSDFQTELGHWNPETRMFVASDQLPSTIRVTASRTGAPMFFGRLLGKNTFDVSAESIARYQPRDIALVLDFSASMCYDSQLRRIKEYGESNRAAIEASLQTMYQDLGSPTYGTLPFTPAYLTVVGAAPKSPAYRQVTVTFRLSAVDVSSTKSISSVKLKFSDGTSQTFSSLSGTSVTKSGTGSNSGKTINQVFVKSGTGDTGEWLTDDATAVKKAFGLNGVSYPYADGSWDDYVNYARTNAYVSAAGYKRKYGAMTLINYWQEVKTGYNQTCDLWKTSEQPIKAVKDAVGVFMDFIQLVDCDDRVALAIYNSHSQTAALEHVLTEDLATVEDIMTHRQAGHYDRMTNIGAGIHEGILELDNHARIGAFKMIVLMTDGNANLPGGEAQARQYALDQAELAAERHYPVVTISLGIDADTDLMQQIAETTGGIHFNIPGGQAVNDYADELQEVFRKIAQDRPLIIVK